MDNDELSELFYQIRNGNDTAFEKLYNEMKIPVYTVISRIVNNKDCAEEIMQELFVKLYFFPPDEYVKNYRAWIFTVAHNLSIDVLRKEQNKLKSTFQNNCVNAANTYDSCIDIDDAILTLSEIEREIISLHINVGLKFKEISVILNLPLGTVLWRYRKALDKLRLHLSEEEK